MDKIEQLKTEVSQLRDEAKVQLELGRMELREEWKQVETKWNHFLAQARIHQSEQGIKSALVTLGDELRAAYRHLKDAL